MLATRRWSICRQLYTRPIYGYPGANSGPNSSMLAVLSQRHCLVDAENRSKPHAMAITITETNMSIPTANSPNSSRVIHSFAER
jgi:hypothetical protein